MTTEQKIIKTKTAGITGHAIHSLRHSIAVQLLDAGRGIEYVDTS